MPTVFLSYNRADLPLIKQLEGQLKSHPDIAIWRDQDKIYGGQKWSKVLGEAICWVLALLVPVGYRFIQWNGLRLST